MIYFDLNTSRIQKINKFTEIIPLKRCGNPQRIHSVENQSIKWNKKEDSKYSNLVFYLDNKIIIPFNYTDPFNYLKNKQVSNKNACWAITELKLSTHK